MKAVWTRWALRDLESLHAFISEDDPVAALRVVRRIQEAASVIGSHPEIGRLGRVPDTREFVIPNTPYIIVYRLSRPSLEVVAVIHGAQRWPE